MVVSHTMDELPTMTIGARLRLMVIMVSMVTYSFGTMYSVTLSNSRRWAYVLTRTPCSDNLMPVAHKIVSNCTSISVSLRANYHNP